MAHIPEDLQRLVLKRAEGRCEYCGLSQAGQEATFHIDHILPIAVDGPTESQNLALACVSCSLRKAARTSGVDPIANVRVALYHPRQDRWTEHFRWRGCELIGLTATGRATIASLDMNRALIVAIREEEAARGRHPPRNQAELP